MNSRAFLLATILLIGCQTSQPSATAFHRDGQDYPAHQPVSTLPVISEKESSIRRHHWVIGVWSKASIGQLMAVVSLLDANIIDIYISPTRSLVILDTENEATADQCQKVQALVCDFPTNIKKYPLYAAADCKVLLDVTEVNDNDR